MDIRSFEETELAYLQRSFMQHGISTFGRADVPNASPLYAWLALQVAKDKEILRLVLHANTRPQRPHMLFAAVQYLLFSGIQNELAEFYPNLTIEPRPREEAYPFFRSFCLQHADEIKRLVTVYSKSGHNISRYRRLKAHFNSRRFT